MQETVAAELEQGLVGQSLGEWFRELVGFEAILCWESNDCGEQTGDPALDEGRQIPLCVEAWATLTSGEEVGFVVDISRVTEEAPGQLRLRASYVRERGALRRLGSLKKLQDLVSSRRGLESVSPGDPRTTPFDWTLGTWQGVRRDGEDGTETPMTLRVEPILSGRGQIRHIEILGNSGAYLGFAVQVFDPQLGRWVRQYVNSTHGRFSRLEGELVDSGSIWRSTSPARKRDSRLVSERLSLGRWRRTMSVSEDGGSTWRVLWIDDLEAQTR